MRLVVEPYILEGLEHPFFDLFFLDAGHVERVGHVFVHRAVGDQLEVLENDTDLSPKLGNAPRLQGGDVLAVDEDLPFGWPLGHK